MIVSQGHTRGDPISTQTFHRHDRPPLPPEWTIRWSELTYITFREFTTSTKLAFMWRHNTTRRKAAPCWLHCRGCRTTFRTTPSVAGASYCRLRGNSWVVTSWYYQLVNFNDNMTNTSSSKGWFFRTWLLLQLLFRWGTAAVVLITTVRSPHSQRPIDHFSSWSLIQDLLLYGKDVPKSFRHHRPVKFQ